MPKGEETTLSIMWWVLHGCDCSIISCRSRTGLRHASSVSPIASKRPESAGIPAGQFSAATRRQGCRRSQALKTFQLFPFIAHRLILFDEVLVWGVCSFELCFRKPVGLPLRLDSVAPGG